MKVPHLAAKEAIIRLPVFANILNAESVTIWKDVEGVMNADL
ncbi:MAG: hypothetical protein WDM71_10605 [Ferruginibacter sp.]